MLESTSSSADLGLPWLYFLTQLKVVLQYTVRISHQELPSALSLKPSEVLL